jgi:hypothetical protein
LFSSSTKRRSRAHKRDLTPVSMNDKPSSEPLTLARKRSASENDLPFFQIDDEQQSESSTPFVDAHSRMNSIDSRKKNLLQLESEDDDEEEEEESYSDSADDEVVDYKTTRTLSNPIAIEQPPIINELMSTIEESNTLINEILSQSAPIMAINSSTLPIRISQSTHSNTSYYLNENFSPTSTFSR